MPAVPHKTSTGGIRKCEVDPRVVQQLMFNRLLAYLRPMRVDHVTVTGFDATTSTIEATLAGVTFVVNISVEEN
jgi:hypothetical protein